MYFNYVTFAWFKGCVGCMTSLKEVFESLKYSRKDMWRTVIVRLPFSLADIARSTGSTQVVPQAKQSSHVAPCLWFCLYLNVVSSRSPEQEVLLYCKCMQNLTLLSPSADLSNAAIILLGIKSYSCAFTGIIKQISSSGLNFWNI